MQIRWRFFLLGCILVISMSIFAREYDNRVDSIMSRYFLHRNSGYGKIGELFGELYVKQRVGVLKNNLALNIFPDMTRFDKGVDNYVTELFYDFYYTDYGILELRRKNYNTSFRHGKGEIDRAIDFMKVNPYDEKLLQGRVFSPLNPDYKKYYHYRIDSLTNDGKNIKVFFQSRFDNIRLLTNGWIWFDDSCHIQEFVFRGWDEQSRYEAIYKMSERSDGCGVVENVCVDIYYNFLGNKLNIAAEGYFDYKYVLPVNRVTAFRVNESRYDLSGSSNILWDTVVINDRRIYAINNRPIKLDDDEKHILGENQVLTVDSILSVDRDDDEERNDMWEIGDAMICSHSYDWRGGRVKFSPLINPSYLSYSSNRGFSYKFSMNMKTSLGRNREFRFKPQIGYNFKQKALYWDIDGRLFYNPSRLGQFRIDVGEGNQIYSSVMLDEIKSIALDSLKFGNLNLDYFRNFYMNISHESEISNGLEMLIGVNFRKRVLKGDADKILDVHKVQLNKKYTQFAPHMRFTWQPGMYYYMNGNKKINLGSRYPVIAWDVEQGINGVLGSNSIYFRSELDVQYNWDRRNGNVLYLRFGAGGYFYTKDVYFVDYAFLKQNNLPVERSEELGGVFQLLDSEWYNAADKYVRAHFTYEIPFFSLQKLLPHIKLFQSEYLYYNILFISHLKPYMEFGYGVATPYVDMGVFVSSQNEDLHRIGYKISFSLFSD